MCYKVSTPKKYLAEESYEFAQAYEPWDSSHHLANGFANDKIPTIVNYKDAYRFIDFEMGLIHRDFSKVDELRKYRTGTINAKSENIFETWSFKESIYKRRCLVIVDGFYEPHTVNSKLKVPYLITLKDREVFALAGVWDAWTHPVTKEVIRTCSILTTPPNSMLATIHNKVDEKGNPTPRMPLVLAKEDEKKWLDPSLDKEGIKALFNIYPQELMAAQSVNKLANANKDNDLPQAKEFMRYDAAIPAVF